MNAKEVAVDFAVVVVGVLVALYIAKMLKL
jgi:hypothetical protein